jgi:hypothetical protein
MGGRCRHTAAHHRFVVDRRRQVGEKKKRVFGALIDIKESYDE